MKNQTVLITGGTAGIGFALAQHLVHNGAHVVITGRDPERLANATQRLGCAGYLADSTQLTQIQALAGDLQRDQIKLDGLVLNAGVFFPEALATTREAAFDLTFNTNTKGPFFTLQALLPCLKNPASVVFVSSIAVHKAFPGAAVYAASKAAFEAIVRVANLELAPSGIRINSVRPGVTATEIQGKAGMSSEAQAAFYETLKATPFGRVMSPEDQVGAIEFLLSNHSLPLRNAVIEVDGGLLL